MLLHKKLTAAAVFLLILVMTGCGRLYSDDYRVPVTLNGATEVTVECGSEYTDSGAKAFFCKSDAKPQAVELPIVVRGEVDTSVPGDYTLSYIARYDGFVGTAYRMVHVVDVKAPQIVLHEEPGTYTLPGAVYVEEGYTATDDCDGDLTHAVVRTETRDTVTYTVSDAAGNTTTVQRPIVYSDPVPPVITLNGSKIMTVGLDTEYMDPGVCATDNCDGDLTGRVVCVGTVDTSREGNYTLTYKVTDAAGNHATVSRMVKVQEIFESDGPLPEQPWETPALPEEIVPNGKVIYLTFDDGPSSHTPFLLDVLAKYNVKATFFVVNNKYIDIAERISREGHTLALHSSSHDYRKIYASEDAYFADLNQLQQLVHSVSGVTASVLRFPGGSSNTVSRFNPGIMTRLSVLVKEQGFRYFDWNVDSKDAGGAASADEVYANVVDGIGDQSVSVVLQHDIKGFSVEAVERIIQWGLANGYTFLPLGADSPACEHTINN